jgi:4-hydroxybutyrate CoA-transferase
MENYLALKDAGISVDLLGQANSESVGLNVVNGVGGMMDFVRGAISSEGGKAVEMSLM